MWWLKDRCSSKRMPRSLYERDVGFSLLECIRSSSETSLGLKDDSGSLSSFAMLLFSKLIFLPRVWKIRFFCFTCINGHQ